MAIERLSAATVMKPSREGGFVAHVMHAYDVTQALCRSLLSCKHGVQVEMHDSRIIFSLIGD